MSTDRARLISAGRRAALFVGLLLVVASAAFVIWQRPDPAALAGFGYPGVAIIMFFSASTVLFPAPGFATVLAAGTVWNPLLVGLAAGFGAATGELSGYLVGRGGEEVLHLGQSRGWRRAHSWLEKHGSIAVFALAAVPNPLFDVMGLVAGSLSFPARRFWLACFAGNTLKYAVLALVADSAAGWWLAH